MGLGLHPGPNHALHAIHSPTGPYPPTHPPLPHPTQVLLSLIFWGRVWGLPGMLLAAPITAAAKLIFESIEVTLPFAMLLSGDLGDALGQHPTEKDMEGGARVGWGGVGWNGLLPAQRSPRHMASATQVYPHVQHCILGADLGSVSLQPDHVM